MGSFGSEMVADICLSQGRFCYCCWQAARSCYPATATLAPHVASPHLTTTASAESSTIWLRERSPSPPSLQASGAMEVVYIELHLS